MILLGARICPQPMFKQGDTSHLPGPPEPVSPSYIPVVDEDSLVVSMIAEAFKEDSAGEKGDLKSLDIHVDTVFIPSILADCISDNAPEHTVEVEKEEQCHDKSDDKVDRIHPVEPTVR